MNKSGREIQREGISSERARRDLAVETSRERDREIWCALSEATDALKSIIAHLVSSRRSAIFRARADYGEALSQYRRVLSPLGTERAATKRTRRFARSSPRVPRRLLVPCASRVGSPKISISHTRLQIIYVHIASNVDIYTTARLVVGATPPSFSCAKRRPNIFNPSSFPASPPPFGLSS